MDSVTPKSCIQVPPKDDQIVVGTVVGTHGYKGYLRVLPETDNPARYAKGSGLTIGSQTHTVQESRSGTGNLILLVKLNGVDSLHQASNLVDQLVLVNATDAPELPEGTYYHFQLIGMEVCDTAGSQMGKLTEIISTGANDVYVVTNEVSEIRVPALAKVIITVDVEASMMTVEIPEGIEPRMLNRPKTKRHVRRRPQEHRTPPAPIDSL